MDWHTLRYFCIDYPFLELKYSSDKSLSECLICVIRSKDETSFPKFPTTKISGKFLELAYEDIIRSKYTIKNYGQQARKRHQ